MYFFYKYGRFIFLRGYFSTHGAVDPWQQRVVYSPVFCIKIWTVPAPNKFGIETSPNSDNTTRCGRHSIVRDRGGPRKGGMYREKGLPGQSGRAAGACMRANCRGAEISESTHSHSPHLKNFSSLSFFDIFHFAYKHFTSVSVAVMRRRVTTN